MPRAWYHLIWNPLQPLPCDIKLWTTLREISPDRWTSHGTVCILWHGVFHGTHCCFFCYRAPGPYFAFLKHQTYPGYIRQPWPFVFQWEMCRRGRKKGKKWCCPCCWTEICVHQGSEGRDQGRGRSNGRKRCLLKQNLTLESYSVWRESQKHYAIKGAGKRIRYSQNA